MRISEGRVGAREISVVIRQLAMFVTPRNTGCGQQGLSTCAQLAIAAGDSAVVEAAAAIGYGGSLPPCAFTYWANLNWGLDQLDILF